jgi:hypothetical protein
LKNEAQTIAAVQCNTAMRAPFTRAAADAMSCSPALRAEP